MRGRVTATSHQSEWNVTTLKFDACNCPRRRNSPELLASSTTSSPGDAGFGLIYLANELDAIKTTATPKSGFSEFWGDLEA